MGYLPLAALAGVFNGSWTLSIKIQRVAAHEPHPLIFNLYFGCGFLVASFIPVAGIAFFQFSALGILSGVILDLSILAAFSATQLIGVALASGIFCCVGVVTGFIWSVAILQQECDNLALALVAVGLVLLSVVGILSASRFGPGPLDKEAAEEENRRRRFMTHSSSMSIQNPIMAGEDLGPRQQRGSSRMGTHSEAGSEGSSVSRNRAPTATSLVTSVSTEPVSRADFVRGVGAALLTGIFGGHGMCPVVSLCDLACCDHE